MLNEAKLNNLYQFLTSKNSNSSKKVSLNIRSETTSPSSYNERNYSTQTKPFHQEINNKNQIYYQIKKSNTIDKNCYNNINLLTNLKDPEENLLNSFSKDLNKSNLSNSSKLSVLSISKNKNSANYDKSIFLQIMKYYTRKSKNEIIQNNEINFFLNPINIFLNKQKKNVINIKNIKKELEEKISKKGKKENQKNNSKSKINSNENRNYIGIDENFNLTFRKSSNKIEMFTNNGNNLKRNIKTNKSNNNKKINNNNLKFNINNCKNNNINTMKNIKNKNSNNDIISIAPQSQRNSDPPVLISENIFKGDNNRKIIDNGMSKEESTPSFLNESNKEDEKKSLNKTNQFKTRKINLPKNCINLDNLKLNNHILQNLLNHRKNNLISSKNKVGKNSKINEGNEFDSSRLKVMDKKINIMNDIKTNKNIDNKNFNLNHFNRDYSGKKNYKKNF